MSKATISPTSPSILSPHLASLSSATNDVDISSAPSPQSTSQYIAWAPLAWMATLHLGALLALNPAYFSWSGLALAFFTHWIAGGIGICMGYHRLLTHRSFATRPKWLEYVITGFGCLASEGGPISWVADHRRHHAHSDEEDDTHSPNRGFGWAHMFWWMTPDITSRHTPDYLKRWAPDLCKDPVMRVFNSIHFLFPLMYAWILYSLGGMSWLVWGFFVGTVSLLHSTWLVNSATHVWGYRNYETRDRSTNLWWVALLTYGEGWHNNHHAFQTSARHGIRRWEIDPTYLTIRFFEAFGIFHSIKHPKLTRAKAVANETAKGGTAPASASNDPKPNRSAPIITLPHVTLPNVTVPNLATTGSDAKPVGV